MIRRISGFIISVGALVFIIGVTRPVIVDFVFAGIYQRRQLIELNFEEWLFGHLAMGVGGLIIGAGIVIFAFAVHKGTANWLYRVLAYAAAITGIVATSCWMYTRYGHIALPAEVVSLSPVRSYKLAHELYINLMIVSIVLTGFVILLTYTRIGGILIMVAEIGVVLITLELWNEIIPGIHPPIAFMMGVILMIAPSFEIANRARYMEHQP